MEMGFQTNHPQCEIFLTSEKLGFLMLTSSGEIYRKWNGLTTDDLSVFADLRWTLIHEGEANFSYPDSARQWQSTQRTEEAITRQWSLHCGCAVHEIWRWPRDSMTIEIRWTWRQRVSCGATRSVFSVTPLWTLCPAGSSHSGGGQARISQDPRTSQILSINSELLSHDLRIHGISTENEDAKPWSTSGEGQQEYLATPADSARGENGFRSVLLTHTTQTLLQADQTALLKIEFSPAPNSRGSNGSSPNSAKLIPFSHLTLENANPSLRDWQSAFVNCQLSLNQLIRRRSDGTFGLQAGLPWFTQFWTRDLCHSFRAAFLWSGRLREAELLVCDLWAKSQKAIPNYTTSTSITNNSADALPLLLLTTCDLIDVIGVSKSIESQFSKILSHLRSGALIFSQRNMIKHGEADTWMDAQKITPNGESVACSPRADRAFEIQAFWIAALSRWASILYSSQLDDDAKFFSQAVESGLEAMRIQFFCPEKLRWADHLRPDGSQDLSLRPNLLLGFSALKRAGILQKLISEQEVEKQIEEMIEANLIVSYGVRTLSPETSTRHSRPINEIFQEESSYIFDNKIHFHPFHEFGSRRGLEHPDWAYHNGTIWPWLSHCATQFLLLSSRHDVALQLMQTLVWHSAHGTQGGAIAELLDGLSSHSHWSWPKGAPHQAWSEAALIHLLIEEWIGIEVKCGSKQLIINPRNWKILGNFSFEFSIENARVIVSQSNNQCSVQLCDANSADIEVEVLVKNKSTKQEVERSYVLKSSQPIHATLTG